MVEGPWRHREITANGQRFHAVEAGEGPLVLLLHGFPQFWWSWRHVIPVLADAGFRVVAPDLRGYGASDKPPRGYDLATLSNDVTGMIPALGERKAIGVGHGWGGLLAWTTAVLHRAPRTPPGQQRHRPPARGCATPSSPTPASRRRSAGRPPRCRSRGRRAISSGDNADAMMRLRHELGRDPAGPTPRTSSGMRDAFQLPGVGPLLAGVLPLGVPFPSPPGRHPVRPSHAAAGLGPGARPARLGRPRGAAPDCAQSSQQCTSWGRSSSGSSRAPATSSPKRRPTWSPPRWSRSDSPT